MSGEIVRGRELEGFDDACDVVVVGSGAGGAVVATHLAEAGLSVIVLEEGPHYTTEEIRGFRPTEAMRKMWREGGLLTTIPIGNSPIIAITVGRNVGGSSVHTGGVCFRVPSSIHREWERDHDLPELSERKLEAAYLDVERRVHVTEVRPEERSESTRRFAAGAAKLGIPVRNMRRNTVDCEGNSVCNFGCPKGAKMSVDLSYLPSALANGARVVADALATHVLFDGDRAVGVEGFLTSPPPFRGTKRARFKVRARAVVSACGTLHSPLLLDASGVKNAHLGRHMTLHPSLRIGAMFDERIAGWNGVLQSAYSDHFHADGITLNSVYAPVNVLAGALPGVGPSHRALVRKMANFGIHGALVHDEGGGVVRRVPGAREGLVTYELAPRDLARMRRALTILGEVAFAAGAREVMVPIFGVPPVRDLATLRGLETGPLDAKRIETTAFHPLGSARMANDPRRGVTDDAGEVFGTRGLFLADGSVLPSSIGVNSQLAIMSMATRIAWLLRDRLLAERPRRANATEAAVRP